MIKIYVNLLCACLLLGCGGSNSADTPGKNDSADSWAGPFEVLKVLDGDSIQVREGRKILEVRLFGIDAPEHDQPGSKEAKRFARKLLANRSLWLKVETIDRYDRSVAWVAVQPQGQTINAQLVAEGMAWVYRQYTDDRQLIALEDEARATKKGLWRRPKTQQIPPWQWRKRKSR